ncbi:helical backbone metal receptor [Aquincola sp. MAHUQ-54]|uniref:Helical backbone metal receptor n=1 Tax=Aquincola agrisoli TaxID=3119538 RepID=A0AAW9Q3E9_9BURK
MPPAWALAGLAGCALGPALAGGPAPQRIVALSPSLTEAVCALGRCDRLVATDRHSAWPATVAALPKVGGIADAQIERIVAMKPDLVLLGPRSRAGDRLADLGVPVRSFDARTHADLRHTLLALGDALGEQANAVQLVRRIDERIAAAARRLPAAWRGRTVYVEVGSGAYAASEASFIGETLARLGLVNIVGSGMGLFPKLNPEFVARRAPELIIGPRTSLGDYARRPGWATLPAVRRQQVCLLDNTQFDLLAIPGPRLGEAADMLVDCLLALQSR